MITKSELIQKKKDYTKQLKTLSKKEIFNLYCEKCLGKIHSANIKEQNKSWMIHDIVEQAYSFENKFAID